MKTTLSIIILLGALAVQAALPDSCKVTWSNPSKDATGQMPFGNGDIAAGAYAIENGDLHLLLSENDAYNHMGDLFKTGRVRVSLSPNPFAAGNPRVHHRDQTGVRKL